MTRDEEKGGRRGERRAWSSETLDKMGYRYIPKEVSALDWWHRPYNLTYFGEAKTKGLKIGASLGYRVQDHLRHFSENLAQHTKNTSQ